MQIDELRNQLIRYNDAYRAGKPLITDAQYDALVEQKSTLPALCRFWRRGKSTLPVLAEEKKLCRLLGASS